MSDDDEEGARVIPFRGGDPDYVPPPIPAYADEPAPTGDIPEPPAFPTIPPRPAGPPVIPPLPPLPDPMSALHSSDIPAPTRTGEDSGEFGGESGGEIDGEFSGSLADRFADWIDYRVAVGQARLEEEKPYREAKIAAKAAKLQARTEARVARLQANTKLRQAYGKGKSDLAAARSTGADRGAGRGGGLSRGGGASGGGGRSPGGGRSSGAGGLGGNRSGSGGGSGRSPSPKSAGGSTRSGGQGRGPGSGTGPGGSGGKSGSGGGGTSPKPGGTSGGLGTSGGSSGGSGKSGGSGSSNGKKNTRASGAGGKSGGPGSSPGGSSGSSSGSGGKTGSGGKSGSGSGSSGGGKGRGSGGGASPIRHTAKGPGRPPGGPGAGSGTGGSVGRGKGRHSGSEGSGSGSGGGGSHRGGSPKNGGPGESGRDTSASDAKDRGRRVVRHRLKNGKKTKSRTPWDRKVLTPEEEAAPAWDRHHAGCPVDYDAADYAQLAIERGDYEEAKKIINASACPVRTADEALRMLGSPEARWLREHAKKDRTHGPAGERSGTTAAGTGAARPADDSREGGPARRFLSWLRNRASGRRPEDASAEAKAPPVPADTIGWHTEAGPTRPARTAYAPPLPEPLALEASAGPLPYPPPAAGPEGGKGAAETDPDQEDDLPVVPLVFPPPRAPQPVPTTDEEHSMAKEVATAQTGLAAQHRTDITFDEYLVLMAQAAAASKGYHTFMGEAAGKLTRIAKALKEMADDLAGDHNIAAMVTMKVTEMAESAERMRRQAERAAAESETAFEQARRSASQVAAVYGEDMAEVEDKGLASASAAAHHE